MMANMTALQKRDGGVGGIATGTLFRRLVAKTLARQFSSGSSLRSIPVRPLHPRRGGLRWPRSAGRDANPMTTVLSLKGIGAYDHVYRASVMSKLLEVPSLHHLLPFVRQAYGSATSYS